MMRPAPVLIPRRWTIIKPADPPILSKKGAVYPKVVLANPPYGQISLRDQAYRILAVIVGIQKILVYYDVGIFGRILGKHSGTDHYSGRIYFAVNPDMVFKKYIPVCRNRIVAQKLFGFYAPRIKIFLSQNFNTAVWQVFHLSNFIQLKCIVGFENQMIPLLT